MTLLEIFIAYLAKIMVICVVLKLDKNGLGFEKLINQHVLIGTEIHIKFIFDL